jgi:hypothetical protein
MAYREACEDIILSVRRLDIPKDELIVVGGAALELFGIRPNRGAIDLVVSPERMVKILHQNNVINTKARRVGHIGLMPQVTVIGKGRRDPEGGRGAVTFMPPPIDYLYRATFDELRDEAIDASDVLVSPPERILAWKRSITRLQIPNIVKHLADVELILKYLSTHNDGEPYVTYGGWEPGENPEIISMRKAAFDGALDDTLKSPTFQESVDTAVNRMRL